MITLFERPEVQNIGIFIQFFLLLIVECGTAMTDIEPDETVDTDYCWERLWSHITWGMEAE